MRLRDKKKMTASQHMRYFYLFINIKVMPSWSINYAGISWTDSASIAQLVERPLSEQEVVGSNPAAAPYQRCK